LQARSNPAVVKGSDVIRDFDQIAVRIAEIDGEQPFDGARVFERPFFDADGPTAKCRIAPLTAPS
jgi:hypothetical protein